MNAMIGKAKMTVKAGLFRQKDWVLGRTACMGQDVYQLLKTDKPVWNIQKGRVDYLVELAANESARSRPEQVLNYLKRDDIAPMIMEQWCNRWLKFKPPSLVFMDSYSELTDQMFIHRRDGWRFNCNFLDLDHQLFPAEDFQCLGLLPEADLLLSYERFFDFVRENYGSVPIVFMHFPTKLDRRQKFKKRHRVIAEIIKSLSKRYAPLHSLDLDASIVDYPEEEVVGLEDFPYHYNQRTYKELSYQVMDLHVLG